MLTIRQYHWRHLNNTALDFMNSFSDSIRLHEERREVSIPDLRQGQIIFVASDYSGQHHLAQYEAMSFLFVDPANCGEWERQRHDVRGRHLRDGRRLAYKSLGDRLRRRSLVPFLHAANHIGGLLVVLLVDRQIATVFRRGEVDEVPVKYRCWNNGVFERVLRAVHFVSFFLAGLSRPGQDLLWVTDEDEIAANDNQLRTLVNLFANVSSHYLPHDLGRARIGTTLSDSGRRDVEDLTSVADLAAGALAECAAVHNSSRMLSSVLFVPLAPQVATKARVILDWVALTDVPLKRLVYLIDEDAESRRLQLKLVRLVHPTLKQS